MGDIGDMFIVCLEALSTATVQECGAPALSEKALSERKLLSFQDVHWCLMRKHPVSLRTI